MMERDEFVAALTQARKFGGFGLDPFFESFLAHDQAQRAVIESLRNLCLEAYQVVGSLASDAGMFEHPATTKVLDNLSMAGAGKPLPHKELLPYPASQTKALLEALQLLYDCQNGCPLPKYEADWNRAMQLSERALKEVS